MIKVIPAIDIIGGRCVRLTRGSFGTAEFFDRPPLDMARRYSEAGFQMIHIIDLDGARAGRVQQLDVLGSIVSGTNLEVQFGGGLRTDDDVRAAFDAGAARVVPGSAAVANPTLVLKWLARYGTERVAVAADAANGRIRIDAWRDETSRDVFELLEEFSAGGLEWSLVTDIDKDGGMAGPAVGLYRRLKARLPKLKVIASGGVRDADDVRTLDGAGIDAVVIGKALLSGSISIDDLKEFA
jgi:phosphoribosylformimino-5-aminoimidazole carboxamide ribotide isomerase